MAWTRRKALLGTNMKMLSHVLVLVFQDIPFRYVLAESTLLQYFCGSFSPILPHELMTHFEQSMCEGAGWRLRVEGKRS